MSHSKFPCLNPAHSGAIAPKININDFQKSLQDAVNSAFDPRPSAYKSVTVVMLSWFNNDIGVRGLEQELANVFRSVYGFKVLTWLILEGKDTYMDVLNRLMEINHDEGGDGTLLIFVYSGHGMVRTQGQMKSLFIGGAWNERRRDFDGPCLNWTQSIANFNYTSGDILQILDCCHAGKAASPDGPELLAATSITELAATALGSLFTRALIDRLKAANGNPCPVIRLVSDILREGKVKYQPVYCSHTAKPSVILQKLGTPVQNPNKSTLTAPKSKEDPRVLITAHVENDLGLRPDNLEDFKKWLTKGIPSIVTSVDVELEGFFESNSSLLLLSIPVELWNAMNDHPACSFISIVKSNNKMLEWGKSTGLLHSVPIRGQENLKPGHGSGTK